MTRRRLLSVLLGIVALAALAFLLLEWGRTPSAARPLAREAGTETAERDASALLRGRVVPGRPGRKEASPAATPPEDDPVRSGWIEGRFVDARDGGSVGPFRVRAFLRPLDARGEYDPSRATAAAVQSVDEACCASLRVDDAEGRFRLGPLPPGVYVLVLEAEGRPPCFEADGARSYETTKGIRVRAGAVTDVGTLRLSLTGRFVFRVLDAATERPLGGVRFSGAVTIGRREIRAPLEPAEILENGDVVLDLHVDEGRALETTVVIAKDGYGTVGWSFSGQPEGERFTVRLTREALLEGVVRAGDGAPLPGAVVSIRRNVDGVQIQSVVTDDEGRFAMTSLPAVVDLEVLVLVGDSRRLLTLLPLRLTPGEARFLEIGGPDVGALEGSMLAGGVPLAGALVSLDGPDDRRTQLLTGADGRFRFDGLGEGRYELAVSASEPDVYLARTAAVREGAVTRVQLDLARRIRGRVRITTLDGRPVVADAGAVGIEARRVEGDADDVGWVSSAETRPDGTFEIPLVDPGIYVLTSADDGYAVLEPPRVDCRGDALVAGIDIPVVRDPEDGVIRIQVRDAVTKAPVEDAGFGYTWKNTWGSGGTHPPGTIQEDHAGLGTHRYEVDAPAYVTAVVEVEITATVRKGSRVLDLVPSDCVRIVSFADVSRARVAGLRAGDRLVRYEGRRVRNLPALREALAGVEPEDAVVVEVEREGRVVTLRLPGGRLGANVANDHVGLD